MRPVGGIKDADGVRPRCSAECHLCADGSIGSVHGLLRPQTTIDAPSVEIRRLGRARVSVPSEFCLSPGSPSVAAADATIGSSGNRADECPRQCLSSGDPSARFCRISFAAMVGTAFNGFVGR